MFMMHWLSKKGPPFLQSQYNYKQTKKQLPTCWAQTNPNMACCVSEGVATWWVGLGPSLTNTYKKILVKLVLRKITWLEEKPFWI